ncbi:sugar ABC transporter ATP-binding protein [Vallitaleaceae bacterium 9-2]
MKLEMQNIYKSFGANNVLKGVDISLSGGEICALLGENGAGKSTLMNILGGVINSDSGTILIDGKPIEFKNPVDSLEAGIAFIHQELNLVNDLAIFENMFIGRELKNKYGFLDAKTMIKKTKEIFEKIGLELNPEQMVRDLDTSYKQFIEIARALMMNASIIIMDEPTTSLTEHEIKRVFAMMNVLKSHGVGMVFISHKLKEVVEICNKYTVLRDGNMVATGEIKDVTTDDLAKHMVGHDVRTESLQRDKEIGNEVLRLERLTDATHFRDISLNLRQGEILGVTGLLGDGRSELFQAVFGDRPKYTGDIYIDNQQVKIDSTTKGLDLGIAYVPRNRKENGIIKDMNILENGSLVTLKRLQKRFFIDRKKQNTEFDVQKDSLKIKMEKKLDLITSLSGGNQQKIVLAKWLSSNPKILIMDNPTQGVDVGAKEEIYDIILKLAGQGVGIIVLSSEAQEIIRVCDRSLVMYHGAIVGEVSGEDMNEQKIMRLATGGK